MRLHTTGPGRQRPTEVTSWIAERRLARELANEKETELRRLDYALVLSDALGGLPLLEPTPDAFEPRERPAEPLVMHGPPEPVVSVYDQWPASLPVPVFMMKEIA